MMKAVLVLLAALFVVTFVVGQEDNPYEDPQFGARPILYDITDGATFTCEDDGARCVFQGEQFSFFEVGNGQQTVILEGDVWGANDPSSDTLAVGSCIESPCYVKCNAKCSCKKPDGSDCATSGTRAPTPAPPTPAPVPQICPEKQNTELCSQLMTRVPSNNFFDCYNFCGGIFISSCAFSGRCGDLSCPNKTDDGISSVVLGCTDDDLPDRLTREDGSGSGVNDLKLSSTLFALITAVAWLAV